jgi:flagellar L-ring protein precursor FlgH
LQRTPQVDVVPATPVRYAQAPALAAPATTVSPSGGLFQAASYRPAFEDPRARLPGDTLTIQITERINASQSSSASIDRSGEVSGGVSALPFISPGSSLLGKLDVGAHSSNKLSEADPPRQRGGVHAGGECAHRVARSRCAG